MTQEIFLRSLAVALGRLRKFQLTITKVFGQYNTAVFKWVTARSCALINDRLHMKFVTVSLLVLGIFGRINISNSVANFG